jgi:hypothetical protein
MAVTRTDIGHTQNLPETDAKCLDLFALHRGLSSNGHQTLSLGNFTACFFIFSDFLPSPASSNSQFSSK